MSKQVRKKPGIQTQETVAALPVAMPSDPLSAPMLWAIAFAACVGLLVASTIAVVIHTYTPVPKWDHWAVVLWVKGFYEGQWHFSDLWRQHNEHRILFPRLFLLTDWFLFRGTGVFLLCSILLLHAAHAWIFIREVRAWEELSKEVRLIVNAFIVALFFSGANLENFTWPFQISFILAFYAGTISIYALIRCAEERGKRKVPAAAARWLAVSIGSGIVGAYSLSSGILIWPVLLLTGLILRIGRWVLLSIGIVGGLVAVLYFSGYQLIAGHTNALEAVKQPIEVLQYVCAYLAFPLSKINHQLGVLAGGITLLVFTWELWRILRRPSPPRLVVLSVSVMVFVIAGAFLTALGRMSLGPPEIALRYITPVCIFWSCALLLALAEAAELRQRSTAIAAVLGVAITSMVVTVVPLHLDTCVRFVQMTQAFGEAEVALRTGVDAKEQIVAIYPDPAAAFALVDVLRAHHKSLFAGTAIAVGDPAQPEYRVVSRDRCRGTWEFTAPFESEVKPGESASGWAWDNEANSRPRRVLILDDSRVVRGFAGFTRTRKDVAEALHNGRMASSGWFGFAGHTPGNHSFRAYALLHDGRSLCELSNSADVPHTVYSVFRRSQWTVDSNKTGAWEPTDRSFQFGLEGDSPVAGDWDGSGVTRAGVFRDGKWYLDWNNNGRWDEGDRQISFGLPGDLPVTGDWNHTGVTKLGIFRKGTWILDWNGDHRQGPGSRLFVFGAAGDIPVTGDWDGSGVTRIGVFRRGTWYLDITGNFQFNSQNKVATFGLPGDQPVTGDWSGLGATRIGVYRSGLWILDSDGSMHWSPEDAGIFFGLPGDIAVSWK